jgi:glycosyltransferase involved in cell wall biosynthesis
MESRACLGVVMPVYNEAVTIRTAVTRVLERPEVRELIVVDDCSADGTGPILADLAREFPAVRLLSHAVNQGKGAALRTGFAHVSAPLVIVQDADLEYDPADYPKLLAPLLEDKADVVYGSRFRSGEACRVLYFWHYAGNKFLTLLSNMLTNLNLTDMETGYKAFRSEVLAGLTIQEDRFGFEPEITAKLARRRLRLYEVAISYAGRTYEEGKKIGWRDGFRALWCILKYNLRAVP